ncbi:MAG TPA: glycosyltransferase [Roseiflexaceae bacterium]|nr:glycosyltransferase [Roseiflexaceae bacterium]
MSEIPRILFAISDTGGGHRSGAVAIQAAIEQLAGAGVACYIVDMLTSTGVPIVRDAPNLYDQLSTRWLPVFDVLYQATDGKRRVDVLTQVVYLGAHRNIVRVLEEVRPNLVVSVHPLSNRLIASARRTYRLSFRFITVVTDLVSLHAAWADPEAELCIVPTHEAYERQRSRGLADEKLIATGFPVHPKFASYSGTQHQARQQLGLDASAFTVLLTSGGVGSGNMDELVDALVAAYPAVQLLVVTGRNAALRTELEARGFGPLVRIYGFVDNMEALMAAADIVVTKAGPGTLMEALVMRRPVIVTQAVGMQERGNIDFVLNHELGAFCPTVERIVSSVADLMQPETYAATVERLAGAVPRDGATEIARVLLEQLHLAPPPIKPRLRLPGMAMLHRLSPRRLGAAAVRRLRRRNPGGLRLGGVRSFSRWRRK